MVAKKKQTPAKKQTTRAKSVSKTVKKVRSTRSHQETPFVKGTVMTIMVLSVIFFLLAVNKYGL